ncbi:integumentary mucin C.1-like [Dreissena polymorpha]|uniref:integumentary mucin C.1-like n=1 Tax=Dreissena polymorpha TaxID=45954 RepID=UPI002264FB16|nr:integumentary mucin C.1-like [Dreissena polymorpha]
MSIQGLLLLGMCFTLYKSIVADVCLSCQGVVSPVACSQVETCGAHEVCFMDSFATSNGYIRYNLGCRDSVKCSTPSVIGKRLFDGRISVTSDYHRRRSETVICSQCCHGNLCNQALCGQRGFGQDQGPVCYSCDIQQDSDSCDTIRQCSTDQVCQLKFEYRPEYKAVVYQTACKSPSDCEQDKLKVTQLLALLGQTADTSCHIQCCTSDLCNSVTCPSKSTIAMTTAMTIIQPSPTTTRTTKQQTTIVHVTTTLATTPLATQSSSSTATTTTTTTIPGSTPTTLQPTSTTTEDPVIAAICQNPSLACGQELDPVCSSDHVFYINKCLFAKHYCNHRNVTLIELEHCV